MTGRMIFDRAMMLLGYTGRNGELAGGDELLTRALAILNAVCADLFFITGTLGFTPMAGIDEAVPLAERAVQDILPYGVAMHLAAGEGDAQNQQIFAALYNQKRTLLGFADVRQDVLPKGADAE